MKTGELRAGDLVEVKSAAEILASLDENGRLDALPFMPEMLEYCGRSFRVAKRADKVCDTIHYTGSRRVPETVFLDELRCDGKAHGGCQAECLLFWKESWLSRAPQPSSTTKGATPAVLDTLLTRNTTAEVAQQPGSIPPYRCQATDLHAASARMRTVDPRPYIREYSSGNVSLGRFLKLVARAVTWESLHRLGLLGYMPVPGTRPAKAPPEPRLELQPGEWVRVKSKEEIGATLNSNGRNRGLWFDREMVPYCGGVYRVRARVSKIIDERTGQMLELKNDCVTLDGVTCKGEWSTRRWFCPRAIFPYWRECWLDRVSGPVGALPHHSEGPR
jgi:hypothetical protein